MQDKYSAVWVSHSSMNDFLKCPRLYYLHNVYKDPQTRKKMAIVTPYMSLGIAVHNVLEGLVDLKAEERKDVDLLKKFEEEWQKVTGKVGGFLSDEEEKEFKDRGEAMIKNVVADPKFLNNKIIKSCINIKNINKLPSFALENLSTFIESSQEKQENIKIYM